MAFLKYFFINFLIPLELDFREEIDRMDSLKDFINFLLVLPAGIVSFEMLKWVIIFVLAYYGVIMIFDLIVRGVETFKQVQSIRKK